MKNIRIIALLFLLAVVFISFRGLQHHKKAEHQEMTNLFAASNEVYEAQFASFSETGFLDPKTLDVVEVEEEVDLGFDTSAYLPLGFNAYDGMEFELIDLEVVEVEEAVDLGFDTSIYLPKGFNPYSN